MISNAGFCECSDAHIPPNGAIPLVIYTLANECYHAKKPFILNGDTLDLIIHGLEAYRKGLAVKGLRTLLCMVDTYIIVGNHEVRANWLKTLFKGVKSIKVVNSLDIEVRGCKWHIEHGDRYSLDWSWLRPVYTKVALIMIVMAPGLWLRICRRWRPSALEQAGERDKYTRLTGLIRYNALNDAILRKSSVIIGHTHLEGMIRQSCITIWDGGDARDGSGIRVLPDGTGEQVRQ